MTTGKKNGGYLKFLKQTNKQETTIKWKHTPPPPPHTFTQCVRGNVCEGAGDLRFGLIYSCSYNDVKQKQNKWGTTIVTKPFFLSSSFFFFWFILLIKMQKKKKKKKNCNLREPREHRPRGNYSLFSICENINTLKPSSAFSFFFVFRKKLCTSHLGDTNRLPISAHIIAIYGGRLVHNYFSLAPWAQHWSKYFSPCLLVVLIRAKRAPYHSKMAQ